MPDRPPLLRVACAGCGWTGRRAPGRIVICPTCGGVAAFQEVGG